MRAQTRRAGRRHRDRDAYERLATAEHAPILKAAYAVTGDIEVAREVTQDAFADLFVHWHKVSAYDRPGAWLRRVAIRKAIKVSERDNKRRVLHAAAELTSDDSQWSDTDTESEILPLLDRLSPNQRAAIYLRYYDDLAVGEVADILGCKPATVSVHLNRGRERLGVLLTEPVSNDVEAFVDEDPPADTTPQAPDSEDEVTSHAC